MAKRVTRNPLLWQSYGQRDTRPLSPICIAEVYLLSTWLTAVARDDISSITLC